MVRIKWLLDRNANISLGYDTYLDKAFTIFTNPEYHRNHTIDEIYEITRLFLERGAEVNGRGRNRIGETPLFVLSGIRDDEVNKIRFISLLLEYGADLNLKKVDSISILDELMSVGIELDVILFLLKNGAKVNPSKR